MGLYDEFADLADELIGDFGEGAVLTLYKRAQLTHAPLTGVETWGAETPHTLKAVVPFRTEGRDAAAEQLKDNEIRVVVAAKGATAAPAPGDQFTVTGYAGRYAVQVAGFRTIRPSGQTIVAWRLTGALVAA